MSRHRRRPHLRLLVAGLLAASLLTAFTSPVAAHGVPEITLPIALDHVDAVHWTDTWGAPRSGGRTHVGVDMIGPKMTPLVAAADGVVSWMRHDSSRGNILYLVDDDGWQYTYIHINNDTPGTDDGANRYAQAFGPGIAEGVRVRAGQVIAYMGDSGNAEWTVSHLHFEIVDPDGYNVNPAPIVDAALKRAQRAIPDVDPALVSPFVGFPAFGDGLYQTVHGRRATSSELIDLAAVLTQDGLDAAVASVITPRSAGGSLDRLYEAYFLRPADTDGFNYWMDQYRTGASLSGIAEQFARSREFVNRYGHLTFGDFLDQLYADVLLRDPDEVGKAYWLDLLEHGGLSRGEIVVYFTEGDELIRLTQSRTEVTMLSLLFADRTPSADETADWEALRSSTDLRASVRSVYLTAD